MLGRRRTSRIAFVTSGTSLWRSAVFLGKINSQAAHRLCCKEPNQDSGWAGIEGRAVSRHGGPGKPAAPDPQCMTRRNAISHGSSPLPLFGHADPATARLAGRGAYRRLCCALPGALGIGTAGRRPARPALCRRVRQLLPRLPHLDPARIRQPDRHFSRARGARWRRHRARGCGQRHGHRALSASGRGTVPAWLRVHRAWRGGHPHDQLAHG